jgi:hypothetical protein
MKFQNELLACATVITIVREYFIHIKQHDFINWKAILTRKA